MESGAASPAPPLSPAQGTPPPSPGPLLIRAPLSSPEENDPKAASFSPTSSEEDCFLSGDDEPELGTVFKRPFVAVLDEEFGGPAESEGSLSGSNGEQALLPPVLTRKRATMPKARVSREDEDVADEVFDEGPLDDADGGSSPLSPVVRVVPPPPGVVVGSPGLVVGGDGVPEGNVGDDGERKSIAAEIGVSADVGGSVEGEGVVRSPDGNSNLQVNPDDGFAGTEEEEAFEGGSTKEVGDFDDAVQGKPLSESSVGGEASRDGTVCEHLVVQAAAPIDSPDANESDDEAAAVLENDLVQDAGGDKHVDLCSGNEEDTIPVAASIGTSESVKLQSSFGVTNGAGDDEIFDDECKMVEPLGSEAGQEKCTVAAGDVELLPDNAEAEVAVEEGGAQCGAGADDGTVGSITNETQDYQPSEVGENIGYAEGERISNASGTKERIEEDEALKVVAVSVDSGEAEHSLQKPIHLSSSGIAEESFPLEPKDEENDVEQSSAELQENADNGKFELDAHEGAAVSSAREGGLPSFLAEDSKTAQSDSQVPMVFDVAHNENAPAISIADSDQKSINDGSEAANYGNFTGLHEQSEGGLVTDGCSKTAILGSSQAAEDATKELEEGSLGMNSGFGNSHGSYQADGQIVSGSDEEVMSDEEENGQEFLDSAALTALLKAATGGSSDSNITITAPDATRIFSFDRPAGLGSSIPSLKPAAPRMNRQNIFSPSDLAVVGEPEDMDEEEKKLQDKVEQIRVKFLRLVYRLGHSPDDRVAAQVLYRLGLAEGIRRGRQIGRAFSLENAKKKALQLEEEGKEPLDFSCNILVLGKTGIGKSATINSIFGEEKVHTNAFLPGTKSVKEVIGTVDGVKVHVIDTPGLRPSVMDQIANRRILASIKKCTKKCPPDIVLYVDRLDTQSWDFNDLPLLRSIASSMGSSIWFNAIVALTHAASAPPDGPSGSPLSYEVFVDQRSRVVQHAIRQAAGDMRLMNPVALVENHPSCRRNREGQRVLPNGLSWRSQMLLLCYSSKILSEANSVLKLQDPSPGKLFGFRVRSPPLPYLLSSLLQSRAHPKLATDQGGENGDSDIDLGDLSDSDQEQEEDEYDQLPPFKPLRKAQIAKLTKEQRNAYFDEYDYRVKLLQKKQWKEELRRSKEMKNRRKAGQDESSFGDVADDYDQDGAPATIPVPLPDMVLPPSFDCDNPAHRYRFLEPTSQLLVRPVLDSQGWDHDCGYDGVSLEENLPLVGKFPAGISVQITKDKKEFNIHLDSSIAAKHGESGSTLAGFDIQTVGKQLAYILRSETKFKNLKKNKIATGISVTFLGENIATGLKVEDQLLIGKRLGLVASGGAVRAQGDVAYGANLEMRLQDKDFPIGQDLSTLGLSLMRWRHDLALGANLQSQFSIGRSSKMAVRVGLNNKLSGQITVRTSTSEQLQIALMGILPIAISIYRSIWSGESD